MARKPMGQDEKDRIGQAEMDERRAAENRGRTPSGPSRVNWVADDQLEGLDKAGLVAEAQLRNVVVKASATRQDIIDALRGGAAQPAQKEQ